MSLAPPHPFDAHLAQIDPLARRVTLSMLQESQGDIQVVMLVVGRTSISFDLRLRRHQATYSFVTAKPLPLIFSGRGLHYDGSFEPYAIAAEPCQCKGNHKGLRWNPLMIACVWHDGLRQHLPEIVYEYWNHISHNTSFYCEDGVAMMQ